MMKAMKETEVTKETEETRTVPNSVLANGPNNVLADRGPRTESYGPRATSHEPLSMSEVVSRQYRVVEAAAGRALREAVRFGAILMEVDAMVGGARGRAGDGLRSWLAQHCPEVNYNTARAHKALACKAATLVGGTWVQAVTALKSIDRDVTDEAGGETPSSPLRPYNVLVPDEVAERCIALFRNVDSRRQMDMAYHAFMMKSMADDYEPRALPKLAPADEAKAIWTRVMGVIDKTVVLDAVPLLPEEAARVCLGRLEELTKAVQRHLQEMRGAR